jgi:hypothetical protein
MYRLSSTLLIVGSSLITAGVHGDALDMVRSSVSTAIPMEAGEDESGTYWSISASANFLDDVDIKNTPLGNNLFVIQDGEIRFDTGMSLEIGFGIPIARSLAVELSSGVSYNSVDSVTGIWNSVLGVDTVTGGDGHVYQVPLVAELVWTIYDNSKFRVDLHGGGGMQWTSTDISNVYAASLGKDTANASLSGDAFAFRYQFGIDCLVEIVPNVSLGATCAYSGTTESNFGTASFTTNVPGLSLFGTEDVKTGSLGNLTLGINLRIEF